MNEQHREAASEKKNGNKLQTAPVLEPVNEFAGVTGITGGLIGLDGGRNLQSQAASLNNPSLKSIQRQAIAAQIAQTHGNQHLQRVIQTHLPRTHIGESKLNRDSQDGGADEYADTQGSAVGGPLSFVGANPPPEVNVSNRQIMSPLIQREDDDDDRPSEEERALALARARAAEQVA